MVGSGLTVRTAVGAEMQLQDFVSSHGVAFVHTKAMENIVLKRISTILHGPSVQGNPRKAPLATKALHVKHQLKESQALAHVELQLALDTLIVCIKCMPCLPGPIFNLLVLGDPRFHKNQGSQTSSISYSSQVTHDTDEALHDTAGQACGVGKVTQGETVQLVSSSSLTSKFISKLIGNPIGGRVASVQSGLEGDVARYPHNFKTAMPSDSPPLTGIGNPTPKKPITSSLLTAQSMVPLDNSKVVANINRSTNGS